MDIIETYAGNTTDVCFTEMFFFQRTQRNGFTVYMKYRHDAFSTYWTRLISFKDISGNEVGTLMEESESINNGKIELFGVTIDDAYVTEQFFTYFYLKNGNGHIIQIVVIIQIH